MTAPRYLVFGAAGHIGGPLARRLVAQAGAPSVRLVSSRAAGVAALRAAFAGCECVQADMASVDDLRRVLPGIDAVFIVTPDFFDDRRGAQALIAAQAAVGQPLHVVRVQAEIPGVTVADLAGPLADPIGRRGHLEARALIEAAGLPATFLNIFGYYMDDLLVHFGPALRASHRLLVPYDRPMCWIDPGDVGDAAARVMLAPPPPAPRLIHLNNGEDAIRFSALADRISRATGVTIAHDDDPDHFLAEIGPLLAAMTGSDHAAAYLLADWRMERSHAALYRGNDNLQNLLGRAPRTLAGWLHDHAAQLV